MPRGEPAEPFGSRTQWGTAATADGGSRGGGEPRRAPATRMRTLKRSGGSATFAQLGHLPPQTEEQNSGARAREFRGLAAPLAPAAPASSAAAAAAALAAVAADRSSFPARCPARRGCSAPRLDPHKSAAQAGSAAYLRAVPRDSRAALTIA
ncbi:hypothetical protein CLOP_g8417 [Closterium sp. NIES-67]|nr:hypothetical protein CLOP_g8417 [Closterium sp. NIES-67]